MRTKMGSWGWLISFLCLLSCFQLKVDAVAVMSVDLGNEWMKIAIVSPGKPMEIILNTDSTRKSPVTVSFRDGERYFGEAALSTGVRFPEKSYTYLLDIIGKRFDSPSVALYQRRFPYHKISADPAKGTVILEHPEGMTFTPEELLGMVLQKSKFYAEQAAGDGQSIKEVVITVPPYFTQAERRAVIRSAELAGLKVLQLINSNTAVALNYGVFRRKDFNETTPTNILFYDMGSSSTVASVVSYQMVKTKERGFVETNPQLTVRGVSFDRHLGGFEMQLRLRDHLAKLFAEQRKKKLETVTSNKRAMSKLLKEANRLKKVLSANNEHMAQVENVMDDVDLKALVSRETFEEMCSDLLNERVKRPISDVIIRSGLSAADIDQVILFGGNTRVPKVQQVITEALSGMELGKSVNADEAAALGAAYQAAYLSKGFKVKTFTIKEANLYPIQVEFSRDVEQDDGTLKTKIMQRTLFARNNVYPQKKVLTFSKHADDFEFYVNYGDLSFLSPEEIKDIGSPNISKASVTGVKDALSKHSKDDVESKGIKAHFRLDESGILSLEQVEAQFEAHVEEEVVSEDGANVVGDAFAKFGSTLSKLFGRTEGGDANATEGAPANASEPVPTANATEGINATVPETNATETKKTEIKVKTLKEPITVESVPIDLPEWSVEESKKSREKLEELDAKDIAKYKLEQIKNTLESFITETKMKLFETEYIKAATDEEKEKLTAELKAASEWLDEESDGAEISIFQDKLADLRSSSRSLFERVREHRDRPEAMKGLKDMLNISSLFLGQVKNVSSDQQIFTDVEISTLDKLIIDTHKWVDESEKEQKKLPLSQTPKILVKAIGEKIGALDREVKYLINKARITPPKMKVEEKEAEANQTVDDSVVTEDIESESEAGDEGKATPQLPEAANQPDITPEQAATAEEKVLEKKETHSPSPPIPSNPDETHTEL